MKGFLIALFVLSCTLSFAQKPSHNQLLAEKKKICNTIMSSFSGSKEQIELLINSGMDGLKICKSEDHEYRFIFNSNIALGYYYKQDFNTAKDYFEQSYDEANKANLIEKSLKPLGNLISVYYYLGMQQKADSAAQKLKTVLETTDTIKNKTDSYYNLGIYNQQQKFYYGIALSNFLKSVELHKPIADTTKILKLKLDYGIKVMMVAEIYLYLKQPYKSLEYLNEIKPLLGSSIIVDVAAYGKFVRSYVLLNNKTEALKYYNLLHKLEGGKTGKWSELVSSNLEMANLFLKSKDFKEAKQYIDKADKQSKLDSKEILTSSVNLAYGDYYKAIDDYPMASKYYKIAEHWSSLYNKEQYSDLLESLTAVEIRLGDHATAADYFDKYVRASDSLNQRKISLNLAEMEAKFQNEFKQQRIGVLNKENDAKSIQLKQEKTTRFLLIGGATLLLFALFSIYLNFKNKQKANFLLDKKNQELDKLNEQLTGANETKAKLFSIIAHDLRSPVSQLFTFLKLQQANPNYISEEEKSRHQSKLMLSSATLLATMEDLLLWSKSQMEHFELEIESVNVDELFEDATLLMQNQAEAKNVGITVEGQKAIYVQSDQNLLTIVLRNLLQNAINHAYPTTQIYLKATVNSDAKKVISIINYGEIISSSRIEELLNDSNVNSKSSGYGLFIVKELLQKLNAVLQMESSVNGTTISVVFNT